MYTLTHLSPQTPRASSPMERSPVLVHPPMRDPKMIFPFLLIISDPYTPVPACMELLIKLKLKVCYNAITVHFINSTFLVDRENKKK